MITGELKNKIDSLWETFWTGGLTNPLSVIEQITYLMFIRDLDDVDNLRSREAIMLGLPYKSMFEGEFTVGETKRRTRTFLSRSFWPKLKNYIVSYCGKL